MQFPRAPWVTGAFAHLLFSIDAPTFSSPADGGGGGRIFEAGGGAISQTGRSRHIVIAQNASVTKRAAWKSARAAKNLVVRCAEKEIEREGREDFERREAEENKERLR